MAISALTLGAILTAAGIGGNAYVQNRRADALDRNTRTVLQNQKRKQSELDQERRQTLGDALQEAAVGKKQVQAKQQEASDEAVARMESNSQRADPKENNPGKAGIGGPAGRVIGGAVGRERERNDAESGQRRRAAADMDSLGDVLAGNSRIFRPAQGEINANQQIARGEENRMALELQVAREKAMKKKRGLEIASQISQGVGTGLLAGGFAAPAASGGVVGGGGGQTLANAGGYTTGGTSKLAVKPALIY